MNRCPGKATRFEYGVECCFLPDKDSGYQVPPVYFAANGVMLRRTRRHPLSSPGF